MFDNEEIWTAVINDEEQYSVWPVLQTMPLGWSAVGVPGTKDACLDYVEEVWTDMRPRSLRVWSEQQTAPHPTGP